MNKQLISGIIISVIGIFVLFIQPTAKITGLAVLNNIQAIKISWFYGIGLFIIIVGWFLLSLGLEKAFKNRKC